MIENNNEVSKDLEKTLQALKQAQQRVANEKKKQNEKKRKAENHHKYFMGGIIVKYFPDCYRYDEGELNRILSVVLQTRECQQIISKIKAESRETAHWEHSSFKEQWIDREPTIHIGAVANALERKGIQTERGNINREIIKNNMLLEQEKEMLMLAKQELHSAQYAKIKSTAVSVKNEVMEMIAKVRERKGRPDLPIISGKHLRRISDRTALQSADNAEKFITKRKIDSFESLAKFTTDREQKYQQLETAHLSKGQKLSRLKELSKMYALFAPIQSTYKESQSLKGFTRMKFDKGHKDSLSKYPELKEHMQSLEGYLYQEHLSFKHNESWYQDGPQVNRRITLKLIEHNEKGR